MKRLFIYTAASICLLGLFFLVMGCQNTPEVPPANKGNVAIDFKLTGKWHIFATTFPMWKAPNVRCPALNYVQQQDSIIDRVTYLKNDKEKIILGKDTQDPKDPLHFTWQGSGWMFFLSSQWYIRAADDNTMVIYFSPTLFTPEGMDILVHNQVPTKGKWSQLMKIIKQDPQLAPLANQLVRLETAPCGITKK